MKRNKFPCTDLPEEIQKMIRLARRRRKHAYAPYSKFKVGCALMDERGRIFSSANVESACTNLGVCAERAAVARMASRGGKRLKIVVVAASGTEPSLPCGACRQVLAEFGMDVTVYALDRKAEFYAKSTLRELLPLSFLTME